jgi:hypothetical protein
VLITLVSDVTKTLRALLREGAIDLTLTTELESADRGDRLLTDSLVWVGARDGDAGRRRPLSVALGKDDCGFRAVAVSVEQRAHQVATDRPGGKPRAGVRHAGVRCRGRDISVAN